MNIKELSPNAKKIIVSVIVLILAAVFGITKFGGADEVSPETTKAARSTVTAYSETQTASGTVYQGYTFRSSKLLTSHFEKHGREVGARNESDYVDKANAVISNPSALHKTEAEDGDHVYFLKSTGEIVFLSTDGFIRTYFIADEAYFNRQ